MYTLVALVSVLLPLNIFAAPLLEDRADARFTLYDLPTPLTGPCDLEHGPDGALWGQVSAKALCSKHIG
jgi:hypothetical protein